MHNCTGMKPQDRPLLRIKKTKSTRKVAVGTVKKSIDTMSLAWFSKKVRQVWEGCMRRRTMHFETDG